MKLGLNTMRSAVNFGYWGSGPSANVAMVKLAESLGYDSVWTSEASGTDAVSPLAYLAGHTTRMKLGTAIMQMAARSPGMTAMTAVTMDLLSGGRFILGLGVSGPAVVEAWHSQPYGKPIGKTREYIEIVRQVIARQTPVEHHGEHYDIPYMRPDGTGLAQPIKLMIRPKRPRIPIYVAAMGHQNIRLALEMADGVIPPIYSPGREDVIFAAHEKDRATIEAIRESNGLPLTMQLAPFVPVAVGDTTHSRNKMKPTLAFWLGAMGTTAGLNFYNRLARRYGYEGPAQKIEELYRAGRRADAAAAVPDELVDEVALCGPKERIRERLELWEKSSVTTMIISGADREAVEVMAELVL